MMHVSTLAVLDLIPPDWHIKDEPDLQSPSTKNTGSLVLGHIRGRGALVVRHLLLPVLLHDLAGISSVGVPGDDGPLAISPVHIGIFGVAFSSTFDIFEILGVYEVLGLVLIEFLLGLVVEAVLDTSLDLILLGRAE